MVQQSQRSELRAEIDSGIESGLEMTNRIAAESGVHLSIGGRNIPDVAAISAEPSAVIGDAGAEQPLTVYATTVDGAQVPITEYCEFSTDDAAVATVNEYGKIRLIATGTCTITSSFGRFGAGLTDTTAITVN